MPGIGTAIGIPFRKVRGIPQDVLDDLLGFAIGAFGNIKTGAVISTKDLPVADEDEAYGYIIALDL